MGDKLIEPKVGEVFELDGNKYRCVKNGHCRDCDLEWYGDNCKKVQCGSLLRKDRNIVIFKIVAD